MIDLPRDIPIVVTDPDCGSQDKNELAAIRWATQLKKSKGGQILIMVPRKPDFLKFDRPISRFAQRPGNHIAGMRSLWPQWPGGPVITLWPDKNMYPRIPRFDITGLCIVPWTSAWNAELADYLDGYAWDPLSAADLPNT